MPELPPGERLRVVALDKRHERGAFACGVEALDRYLKQQASQDARRNVASVFVAEDAGTGGILGFYTLSMTSVLLDKLPEDVAKKMPRYPTVPAVRLGRLAVHLDAKGRGLGAHLLIDAMARSVASEIAWVAFIVDAQDVVARSFYAKYGFRPLSDDPNHLFLARRSIEPLFGEPASRG